MTPLKGLLLHSQNGTGDRDLAEGGGGKAESSAKLLAYAFPVLGKVLGEEVWEESCVRCPGSFPFVLLCPLVALGVMGSGRVS